MSLKAPLAGLCAPLHTYKYEQHEPGAAWQRLVRYTSMLVAPSAIDGAKGLLLRRRYGVFG